MFQRHLPFASFLTLVLAFLIGCSRPYNGALVGRTVQAAPSPAANVRGLPLDCLTADPGAFTLAVLPDIQHYTASEEGGTPALLEQQIGWLVQNRISHRIVHVAGLGDMVQHGDIKAEFEAASAALRPLEDAGLSFGVAVGNHDETFSALPRPDLFEAYFGIGRFASRSYYGGHYGSNNHNYYEFVDTYAPGLLVIYLEYQLYPDPAVLRWADTVLKLNRSRQAIIVSHSLISPGNPGYWTAQGHAIYETLKENSNLFLLLGGHISGEGQRRDTYKGHVIYSLLSDYQSREHGGDGWLRLLEFSPGRDEICVHTYSPVLDQFEIDDDSEFTLPYKMQ